MVIAMRVIEMGDEAAETLSAEEREVVAVCGRLMGEIARRKRPPQWDVWGQRELADLKSTGPRYHPSTWFGSGAPVPERYRLRYLAAVHRLVARGLMERSGPAGRTTHLKLTPDGLKLAAQLKAEDAARKSSTKGRTVDPIPAPEDADAAEGDEPCES
jgi:hypothetical protein